MKQSHLTSETQYHKLVIEKVIEEAPDVKTFVLSSEQPLVYKAGQFLTLVFQEEGAEERRSYSFSSSPEASEPMAITLKRIPNGRYSRPLIDKARPGDTLFTTGAAGNFTLPENFDHYQEIFFFAAGIGITPVFSLIKTILFRYPEKQVVLMYSSPNVDETVFYKELVAFQERFPENFRLLFLISSSPDLSRARLSKWLLPQLLQEYSGSEKGKQLFFACGPFAYMRMVKLSLEELNYHPDQFRKENFDTSRPVLRLMPPDTAEHTVYLRLKDRTEAVKVKYPQTILQAAREQHIQLPFSCEVGRCGSCLMRCTEGKIWMSYNEVLTEGEIAAGKMLTCVAYPVFGDATLE